MLNYTFVHIASPNSRELIIYILCKDIKSDVIEDCVKEINAVAANTKNKFNRLFRVFVVG
jgi:hypothetical protein